MLKCPDAQMPTCPDAQMPKSLDAQMPKWGAVQRSRLANSGLKTV